MSLLKGYLDNVFLRQLIETSDDEHAKSSGRRLQSLTKEFIFKHFHPKEARFYKPHFNGRRHFQNDTTNAVESENRAMKYTTGGPKPCDPIDSAHERIADLQATRERRRDRFEATELMTQPTSGETRENWLSDLTRYCNTHLFQQYDERLNYAVRCVTPAEYLVKRLYAPWTGRETLVDDPSKTSNERIEIYLDWYIPKWERTRTIRVCTVNQMTVAVCDCGTYVQNGWCCRHVYSLLLRKPKKEDAAIRWWKTYIFYYGRHHQGMNANLTYLRNNSLPGILIEKKEVSHWHANQIQSQGYQFPIDVGYFDRSLGTPKLRGPSHWTSLRRG